MMTMMSMRSDRLPRASRRTRTGRARALLAAAVVGAVIATTPSGCGPAAPPAPIPRPADLAQADPWVAHEIDAACEAVSAAPRDAARWAVLGDLYYAHDYFGLATDAYAVSLELDPTSPVVRYMLAVSRRADGDTAQALADLELAMSLDATTPHLRWRAAEWLIDTGDLDRAGSLAEEAVRLGPDDRTAIRMLARVRLEQGRPEETITLVAPLLAATPDDAEVRSLRGRALRATGRVDEAARDMLLAGDIQPTWFDDWINRVLIRRTDLAWWIRRIQRTANDGQPEVARAMLDTLREWHPDAREVDFTEGVVLVNEGRLDEAIARFERLVESDPDWAAARIRVAATRLARADAITDVIAALDDREAAETTLVAAIENEPDNEDALALLATTRELLGRPAEAVAPRRTLVERVPGDRGHRLRLARSLLSAGEPAAAIEALDAAVETLGPEGVPAMIVRVEALVSLDRRPDAARLVEMLRSRAPRHPALAAMQRLLDGESSP